MAQPLYPFESIYTFTHNSETRIEMYHDRSIVMQSLNNFSYGFIFPKAVSYLKNANFSNHFAFFFLK